MSQRRCLRKTRAVPPIPWPQLRGIRAPRPGRVESLVRRELPGCCPMHRETSLRLGLGRRVHIHPFEDGNGRIGRAIAEKALSQGLGRPALLSLSRCIEADRQNYYASLETAQRSNEITVWIDYFIGVVLQAQRQTEAQIDFVLRKTQFFDRFSDRLSERQLRVVRRMLNAGPKGFEGGMNARKYASLTKTSMATATRDLQTLVECDALLPVGGGRSTRYELNL